MKPIVDLLEKAKALEAKYGKGSERRPRHYAESILKLRTREERSRALEEVPEIYRDWVRHYVVDHFEKLRHRK